MMLIAAVTVVVSDAILGRSHLAAIRGRSVCFKAMATLARCSIKGSATVETATKAYTISGSGENMWFGKDAFHYAWKQVFRGPCALGRRRLSGQGHRAASQGMPDVPPESRRRLGLCRCRAARRRPDLAAVSRGQGAATHEVQANVKAPKRCESRSEESTPDVFGCRRREAQFLRRGGAHRASGAVLCWIRRLLTQ